MTLADATPVIRHDGNDVATNFSFPYTFWEATEIYVEHRTTAGVITIPVKDTDFTVNGGDGAVGTIDFPKVGSAYATLASGSPDEQLTIKRVLPEGRNTDIAGTYQFDTVNLEGDKDMAIQQQQAETISRSIKIPVSDDPARVTELPGEVARANLSLVFDANGDVAVGGIVTVAEASTAEINSVTPLRYMSPDKFAPSIFGRKTVTFKAIPDATALTQADDLFRITIPKDVKGMNLVTAEAHVYTASSSGLPSIQLHNLTHSGGARDMLSTNITIDENEKDSSTATTDPVIDLTKDDVETGNEIRIDCDVAGTGTAGLEIRLTFEAPP